MKPLIGILLASAITFCAGCAGQKDSVLSWDEANRRFKPGMSSAEVEIALGKPSVVVELGDVTRWEYVPTAEIERGGRESYHGFSIIFRDSKATDIWASETVAR
jgi:outer membrane protein assembly factor BamE (lipoprotein component of BamABCDE complex)